MTLKIKSFQRRILVALVGVGLIPSFLLLLAGTLVLREVVVSAGTAGPWSALAASGQALIDAVQESGVTDSVVAVALRDHERALSEGLRYSGIFSLLAERVLALLPLVATVLALLIAGLSFWVAKQLSGGFSRPIRDLVGWAERLGSGEPLPPPGPADSRGVQEFSRLRTAFREMARELEEGRARAVEAARLHSWTEMARKVAHELKNPLTPMRIAAGSLERHESPGVQEAARVLREEIDRLDDMARTFSQFGRLPEGPPAPVDLGELLDHLAAQHTGAGPEIRLLRPPSSLVLNGYYEPLLRCFRNLLLNALEAAGENGQVELALTKVGDSARVEIRDDGPGIPPVHLERIWDPDFSTKIGGTGLGLPMAKQIVLAHNGRIEVENRPERGALFRIELPLGHGDEG